MGLSSANFRAVVSSQGVSSLTNSSSSKKEGAVFTALARCGKQASADSGASLSFSPKLDFFFTRKKVPRAAEEAFRRAVPKHWHSELEAPQGDISVARVGGSVTTLTVGGGLVGFAGTSGRNNVQGREGERVGGRVGTEEKLKSSKNLLQLGCALVTPGVGASSSGGVWLSQYSPAMADLFAGVVTLGGALAFLQFFNELAKRNAISKTLSRKLVHIGVGLGFMLFWPLYTISPGARYLAAFAPAANGVRVLAIGLGLVDNEALVKSMTREGDRRELLKGPFYYAVAVVVTTVGFWRTSPVGIVSLVNLCAGDGFSDIIGRNFGRTKLPHNKNKSVAGSLGFFVMSSLISMLYLSYFSAFGYVKILPGTLVGVMLVSFLCAVVESLPISTQWNDNFTVPFAAIVLGMMLLPTS